MGNNLLNKDLREKNTPGLSREIELKKQEFSLRNCSLNPEVTFAVWGPGLGLIYLKWSGGASIKELVLSSEEIRIKHKKFLPTHVLRIETMDLTDIHVYEKISIYYVSAGDKKEIDKEIIIPYLVGSL